MNTRSRTQPREQRANNTETSKTKKPKAISKPIQVNFSDHVVLINNGPNQVRESLGHENLDQSVIFVSETPAVNGQRVVAVVDLCSGDDDMNVAKSVPKQPAAPKSIAATATASASAPVMKPIRLCRDIKCPICFEDKLDQIFSTPCGHLYCEPCIKSAIRTRPKCPMCNKAVRLPQIHPIYLPN